jgi:predicted transcriptional regulator of viral defense system
MSKNGTVNKSCHHPNQEFAYIAQNVSLSYVLCMSEASTSRPDWNRLFEIAAGQAGLFTTQQAAEAGYSTHLLGVHINAGRVSRVRRRIYRLIHFPVGEHEELATTWLWSEQAGVISHQTALSLHGLSDVLPTQLHLTLPVLWRGRRLRVPAGISLHYADILLDERTWFGPVPTTNACRTLRDCAKSGLSPDLLRQAGAQAIRRGLVTRIELGDVDAALKPFGGFFA